MSSVGDVIGRLYSHFISRDIIYLAGGLLILSIPLYDLHLTSNNDQNEWWEFIIIIILSYLLGFFAQQCGLASRAFRSYRTRKDIRNQESKTIFNLILLQSRLGNDALVRLERIITVKQIASITGSSSFITLIVLNLYHFIPTFHGDCGSKIHNEGYIFFSLFLIIYGALMIWCNNRESYVQAEVIDKLIKENNIKAD